MLIPNSKTRVVNHFCINLPILQLGLELRLHPLALFPIVHGILGDDILEIEVVLDNEPSGKQMVVVHVLHERLDSRFSLLLLLAHFLRDLPWASVNASDESMGKLSAL